MVRFMTGIIILSTFAVYTISKADVQFSLSLIHTLTTHPSPLHRQECILISLLFPFISIHPEPHHQYRQYNAFRKASATSFTSSLSQPNQPTNHPYRASPHSCAYSTAFLFPLLRIVASASIGETGSLLGEKGRI